MARQGLSLPTGALQAPGALLGAAALAHLLAAKPGIAMAASATASAFL